MRTAFICGALLAAQLDVGAAQNRPPPESIVKARPAWRYDPAQRCPGLEVSPGGYGAVIVFHVSAAGAPSQAYVGTSSNSATLDAAALACVGQLKFTPASKMGEGTPVESWQALALRTAYPEQPAPAASAASATGTALPAGGAAAAAGAVPAAAAVAPAAASVAASSAAVAASAPAAIASAPASAAAATSAAPRRVSHPVEVRACVDAAGKVTQEPTLVESSGDPQLDQAALSIARSGSAYFRPATKPDGKAVSGCVQMALKFETQ